MSYIYSTPKKSTGVYCIKNIITGDLYIGSSVNCLYTRWKNHYTLLNTNKHHNRHLQNAVNKYGICLFIFGVLEYCDIDLCISREQQYIDSLRPKYNIALIAGNTKGVKKTQEAVNKTIAFHTGRKRSEDSKQRMREARKGITLSEEHKKNIGLASKGNAGHSHRIFKVISPDNIVYVESGIRPFCKTHSLNQGQFNQMILGKLKTCKGWKVAI